MSIRGQDETGTNGVTIEGLEDRRLLSATLTGRGALVVAGTRHSDSIEVTRGGRGGASYYATVDGVTTRFAARSVRSLSIAGGRGADDITVSSTVNPVRGVVVSGDDGNDTIHGGGGHEILHGGNGDDDITGGDDGDTVLGEAGDDSLVGGAGNDHVDGGGGVDHEHGGQGRDDLIGGNDDDLNDDDGQDTLTHDANEDNGGNRADDPAGDDHGGTAGGHGADDVLHRSIALPAVFAT